MTETKLKPCPTCASVAPHLHPAMQSGGEVELCTDIFHLQPTPLNKHEYIVAVQQKRERTEP